MGRHSLKDEEYLTTKELAARLRMSKSFFDKGRGERRYGPPYLKLNGKILYPVSEAEAWLETLRCDPEAQQK